MPTPLTQRPQELAEPRDLSRGESDTARWPLGEARVYDARTEERMRWKAIGLRLHAEMQRCNPILAAAMVMTVAGWGLMWAQALLLLHLVPLWVPVAAFGLGLALIPFGSAGARTPVPDTAVGIVPASRESVAPTLGADQG